MTAGVPTVCTICGATLDEAAVNIVGPQSPGVGCTIAPVYRICRGHLVPKWLFARFSPRQREIAVDTALASRKQSTRDWRPVVRTKLGGASCEPRVSLDSRLATHNSQLTPLRFIRVWLRWQRRSAKRAKLTRRLLSWLIVPKLRQARRRAERRAGPMPTGHN